jgi:hypothetical protein
MRCVKKQRREVLPASASYVSLVLVEYLLFAYADH